MLLEALEPDGSLTFLTHLSSQKVAELADDARVKVAFVGDRGDRYVSVSGRVHHSRSGPHARAVEPDLSRVVSNGPDDPDSAV